MEHRIRGAALIVDDRRLLLVKHQDPHSGEVWWIPPGGGIRGEESLFDCVKRETFEETGLTTEPDRIVYLREFVEPNTHHFELFLLCRSFSGTLTTANVVGTGPDDLYVKDARFLAQEELAGRTVYPEMLQGEFWEDLERGFPNLRYLGLKKSAPAGLWYRLSQHAK